MNPTSQRNQITRRGFLELGSAALATAGFLGKANAANAAEPAEEGDTARTDSAVATGKIALEEHFSLPGSDGTGYIGPGQSTPEFRLVPEDMGSVRIAEMDRGGVELCILSLALPLIPAITSTSQAIAQAQRATA